MSPTESKAMLVTPLCYCTCINISVHMILRQSGWLPKMLLEEIAVGAKDKFGTPIYNFGVIQFCVPNLTFAPTKISVNSHSVTSMRTVEVLIPVLGTSLSHYKYKYSTSTPTTTS